MFKILCPTFYHICYARLFTHSTNIIWFYSNKAISSKPSPSQVVKATRSLMHKAIKSTSHQVIKHKPADHQGNNSSSPNKQISQLSFWFQAVRLWTFQQAENRPTNSTPTVICPVNLLFKTLTIYQSHTTKPHKTIYLRQKSIIQLLKSPGQSIIPKCTPKRNCAKQV